MIFIGPEFAKILRLDKSWRFINFMRIKYLCIKHINKPSGITEDFITVLCLEKHKIDLIDRKCDLNLKHVRL